MIKIRRKRSKLKLGLVIGLTAMILNVPVNMVQASSILDGISMEETTEDYAEDTKYSLLRGNHLNSVMRLEFME